MLVCFSLMHFSGIGLGTGFSILPSGKWASFDSWCTQSAMGYIKQRIGNGSGLIMAILLHLKMPWSVLIKDPGDELETSLIITHFCCFCWHWSVSYSMSPPSKLKLTLETEALKPLLGPSAWFLCCLCGPVKLPLRVIVFSLSPVSLLPCWAKGILLQVTMTTVWPAGYRSLYSNSRKWGYFLTQREQLPALRCMDVCQGSGTPIRVQSLSVVL